MAQFRAGAARVKLEPPVGLAMLGYGGRIGRSIGVHDDLAAQALVFSDDVRKVAIVGVDLLAIGARIADDIRATVAARSDIPADAILVAATHTHSGPVFNLYATPRADAKAGSDRNLQWEHALPEKIANAILQASATLQPATLRAATVPFTLGTNRRLLRADGRIQLAANYAGIADPEASVLEVRGTDSQPIAFVLNYPCHGVVLCEDNLLYSRDWPGFAMDALEKPKPHASPKVQPISIFLQGATGNIDPRSRGSFEVAREHGEQLARDALVALSASRELSGASIIARRIPLSLQLKDLAKELNVAHECVAQTQASLDNHRGGGGHQLKRLRDHHAQSLAALHALEALQDQNRRDQRVDVARGELITALTILAIGDVAFVGIPGELFVELGLALKANHYFAHTFVVGYCNDFIGYLPTRDAYAQRGYEVETARVAADSGELIVTAALTALANLRAEIG